MFLPAEKENVFLKGKNFLFGYKKKSAVYEQVWPYHNMLI